MKHRTSILSYVGATALLATLLVIPVHAKVNARNPIRAWLQARQDLPTQTVNTTTTPTNTSPPEIRVNGKRCRPKLIPQGAMDGTPPLLGLPNDTATTLHGNETTPPFIGNETSPPFMDPSMNNTLPNGTSLDTALSGGGFPTEGLDNSTQPGPIVTPPTQTEDDFSTAGLNNTIQTEPVLTQPGLPTQVQTNTDLTGGGGTITNPEQSTLPATDTSVGGPQPTLPTNTTVDTNLPPTNTTQTPGEQTAPSSNVYGPGTKSGDGTHYTPGGGACNMTRTVDDPVAAFNFALFDNYPGGSANPNENPICGKRIKVQHQGKSVEVEIVDKCSGCAFTDVDLSPAAFRQIGNMNDGRIPVTWDWA